MLAQGGAGRRSATAQSRGHRARSTRALAARIFESLAPEPPQMRRQRMGSGGAAACTKGLPERGCRAMWSHYAFLNGCLLNKRRPVTAQAKHGEFTLSSRFL